MTNEILIGISAMIISLSTLVVFIYQTNLMRKQQYKSVYPYLGVTHMNSNSINYAYVIKNKGIGPAFITDIDITDSTGQSYNSLLEYTKSNLSKKDSIPLRYTDLFVGDLIQEKEEIALIKQSDKTLALKTIARANKLRKALDSDNLKLAITYESIYGESWTMVNNSRTPIKN